MAKRRKLEAPSAEDLTRLEQEFRHETSPRTPGMAPIAQVAAEAAGAYDPRPPQARVEAAKDRVDAERMRTLEGRGLVLHEIPLDEIDADALVRDRVRLHPGEMEELEQSIAANGLRLPIEVFALREDPRGFKYGLLSGYRRYRATQALHARAGDHRTIKALIRAPEAMGGTFAAMIEENEIRAALSHFERGRIAVIASQQGAFPSVEAAVNGLFPVASKAKRSKIRSFALIFEELGDLLTFPEALKERDGLRLAVALREGQGTVLRDGLARETPLNADQEIRLLDAALRTIAPKSADPKRGGRPRSADPQPANDEGRAVTLQSGVVLTRSKDAQGWAIRFKGLPVDQELVDMVLEEIARLLGPEDRKI